MHIYCFLKKKYDTKGPLFAIFKRSSSIHKNNSALVALIVLKKIYFHGICALSKKYIYFHAFLYVRSKSHISRVKNVKNKISRILKLPSWQHQWRSEGGAGGGGICPRAPPGGGRQNHAKEFFKIYILRNFEKSERIQ